MKNRTQLLPSATAVALCLTLLPINLLPATAAAKAHKNLMQKHPVATAVVAGIAAHHMAKNGARGRAAAGKKPNLAERHPMATGIVAGLAAHHMAKKGAKK